MCIVELKGIDNGGLIARECEMLGIGRRFEVALGQTQCGASVISVAADTAGADIVVAAAAVGIGVLNMLEGYKGGVVVGGLVCLE